jgi:hypothetical protein
MYETTALIYFRIRKKNANPSEPHPNRAACTSLGDGWGSGKLLYLTRIAY